VLNLAHSGLPSHEAASIENRMTRVPASDHFVIEMSSNRWRLLLTDDAKEKVLAEAAPGRSLRYVNSFADKRRLPTGTLASGLITQVVLGFSESDGAWHLGLSLSEELANQRGSRWCELVRWRSGDVMADVSLAQQAAQSLAQILEVPFRSIAPKNAAAPAGVALSSASTTSRPAAASAVYAPAVTQTETFTAPTVPAVEVEERPLRTLPVKSGMWTLERTEDGQLQLVRSGRWAASKTVRILWYLFWVIVYVLISVATLTSNLALPNSGILLPDPKVLPILGLATAVVLFILILKNVYELLTEIGRIVIDPRSHSITALAGTSESWHLEGHEIEAIYVSQVVSQRGTKETLHHGELNLYLSKGTFLPLIIQPDNEEKFTVSEAQAKDKSRPKDALFPLNSTEADSSLQTLAVYLARGLNVPAWYDRRTS
jgi:hypothetical protein